MRGKICEGVRSSPKPEPILRRWCPIHRDWRTGLIWRNKIVSPPTRDRTRNNHLGVRLIERDRHIRILRVRLEKSGLGNSWDVQHIHLDSIHWRYRKESSRVCTGPRSRQADQRTALCVTAKWISIQTFRTDNAGSNSMKKKKNVTMRHLRGRQ